MNRYIFPGLALGAALGQTGVVTNAMINRSAEALVELLSEDDLARRATFPENMDIRKISAHLAMRVIQQAIEEGLDVSSAFKKNCLVNQSISFCNFYIAYQKSKPRRLDVIFLFRYFGFLATIVDGKYSCGLHKYSMVLT